MFGNKVVLTGARLQCDFPEGPMPFKIIHIMNGRFCWRVELLYQPDGSGEVATVETFIHCGGLVGRIVGAIPVRLFNNLGSFLSWAVYSNLAYIKSP